jgi:hypothetical protein
MRGIEAAPSILRFFYRLRRRAGPDLGWVWIEWGIFFHVEKVEGLVWAGWNPFGNRPHRMTVDYFSSFQVTHLGRF